MSAKNSNGGIYLLVSLLWAALDQLTKYLVAGHIPCDSPGIRLTPFFNLVHVHNTGAAFSFLAGMGGWQRWFFAAVAVLVGGFLILVLLRTPRARFWTCLPVSLIIGGAAGNLIDRLLWGHVVDFLLFYLRTDTAVYAYPAFNVADIGVTVGAAALIVGGLFSRDRP